MMKQLFLTPRRAIASTTSMLVRGKHPSTSGATRFLVAAFAVKRFDRFGGEGSSFIYQLAASVGGGRD